MKRLYILLPVLLSSLLPALAQQPTSPAKRDTISREVTVVSDKVRQIDDTNPIFTLIPLTKPQIERYNPATPRSTRDFTPTPVSYTHLDVYKRQDQVLWFGYILYIHDIRCLLLVIDKRVSLLDELRTQSVEDLIWRE